MHAIGITALAAVTSVFCVQSGIAAYAREDRPQLTLAVAPFDARAMSIWAGQIPFVTGRADDPKAVELARTALRRDTTLGTPYRVLGFASEARGDLAKADRYIGFADKLSRRDLAAQLWLINRAVARNDVPAAVEHFDVALRTSDGAAGLLFPILANALSEPEVVRAVAPRLVTAPWAQDFVAKAIDSGPSMPGVLLLAEAMNRVRSPFPPETMRQLANRLVETKSYGLLPRFRAISTARLADRQGVADPMFNHPVDVPSFDWAFDEAGRANVARVSDSEPGNGMTFELVDAAAATQVARQLLTLSPGRYRLSVTGMSNIADAALSPIWSVRCAEGTQQLGQVEMTAGGVATVRQAVIDVPPQNCAAQFLILSTRSVSAAGGVSGRVARVAITPA